ncbi:MAG: hypothetical protein CVV27_03965 [Candidatus Melainabacteria bacterium HGW-Melainabacteria-1]|nr:MAG: hypothetical protein CVV27_03965 [Candidatus Melainabacteria bacterium HGW-Melainabacteria-1]
MLKALPFLALSLLLSSCSAGQLLGAYSRPGFGIQRSQGIFANTRFLFELNGRPVADKNGQLNVRGGETLRIQGGDLQKYLNQNQGRLFVSSGDGSERYYAELLQVTGNGVVLKLPERLPGSCRGPEALMLVYQDAGSGQQVVTPVQELSCGPAANLPVVVGEVTVSGYTPQLTLNQSVPFQASILLSDGSRSEQVIWTSSNPDVVRVDALGNVVAIAPGKAVITATSAEDPNKTSSVGVSSDGGPPPVVIQRVLVLNPVQLLGIGSSYQFQGQIQLSDGSSDREVHWLSSQPELLRIESNGQATALKSGYTVITAVSRQDPSKSVSWVLEVAESGTVSQIGTLPGGGLPGVGIPGPAVPVALPGVGRTVHSLQLPYSQLTLNPGDTVTTRVNVRYADGSTDQRVTWYSSNPTIINISPTGIITALGNGTATITAYAQDDFSKSASLSVAVGQSAPGLIVSAVEVLPSVVLLRPGEQVQMGALVHMSNGATTSQVRWESASGHIRVSGSGEVTAVSSGSAELRAVSILDGTKKASATILVEDFSTGGNNNTGSNPTPTPTPTATPTPTPTVTPTPPPALGAGPVITGVSPGSGVNSAAVTLTLSGSNFSVTPAARVFVGTLELNPISLATSRIQVNLPAGFAAGIYDVRIQNPDGLSALAIAAYSSQTPQGASGNVLINFNTGPGATPTPSAGSNVNLNAGFGGSGGTGHQQGTGTPSGNSGVNLDSNFGGSTNGSHNQGTGTPSGNSGVNVDGQFNGSPSVNTQSGSSGGSGSGSVNVSPNFGSDNQNTQPAPTPTPSSQVQIQPQF